jgi:exodeoxyribonuclease X
VTHELCKAFIFDTETTDKDKPEVIEAAMLELELQTLSNGTACPSTVLTVGREWEQRYGYAGAMSWGAVATHHILPEELVGMPPFHPQVLAGLPRYMIGHNIDFDWKAVGCPDVKRVDTMVLARHLWPTMPDHKQGTLLYALWPDKAEVRAWLRNAHSALADVRMNHTLLSLIVREKFGGAQWNFEHLWAACEAARVPTVMAFGKHKGMPMSQVPGSYRTWYANTNDPPPDPYVLKAWGMGPLAGQGLKAQRVGNVEF